MPWLMLGSSQRPFVSRNQPIHQIVSIESSTTTTALIKWILLTCFFSRITLNRSKSVSVFLRSCCSLFLAHDDSAHFWSIPSFSHNFATAPVPAAFGNLAMMNGVSEIVLRGRACRGTLRPSDLDGPSTNIYFTCKRLLVGFLSWLPRTLPWSMISTIVASLPSCGPLRM